MKRVILIALLLIACTAGILLWKKHEPAEAKPAEEKPEESHLAHDELGHVVVKMDDETQGNVGLLVAKPNALEVNPELKGYGKVLDPAALAALLTELATTQAASAASQAEFARLRGLASQGNASESKLQTAEAAAVRDRLAVQSAKDRLLSSWGKGVSEQTNLPAFIEPLMTQAAALVRVDLPVGEALANQPKRARISALSGKTTEAQFLGTASNVDPQTLGRGAIFLLQTNALGLLSGEAVTGYLELPGEPVTGVLIPSGAVVRAEGRGWVYKMNSGSDAFTRWEVPLDHPAAGGWFVSQGITTNDYLVVTGAQVLLSEELKSSLKSD